MFDRHYRATFKWDIVLDCILRISAQDSTRLPSCLRLLVDTSGHSQRGESVHHGESSSEPESYALLQVRSAFYLGRIWDRCCRFAVTHGFIELTRYFWDKISVGQRLDCEMSMFQKTPKNYVQRIHGNATVESFMLSNSISGNSSILVTRAIQGR